MGTDANVSIFYWRNVSDYQSLIAISALYKIQAVRYFMARFSWVAAYQYCPPPPFACLSNSAGACQSPSGQWIRFSRECYINVAIFKL